MSKRPPRFDPGAVTSLHVRLDSHPVYGLRDLDDLRGFMECHIYSVWDFMSLVKYLQHHFAPAHVPWLPGPDAEVRRFITELVLEEETDRVPGPEGEVRCMSHFELYCGAMEELGMDTAEPRRFVELAGRKGIDAALAAGIAPYPAQEFTRSTFECIASDRPHVVAASLALGRERVIPGMFRGLLERMGVGEQEAPLFHFYLKRHIDLDGDSHGPLALRMLDLLCADDPQRIREAEQAACTAIEARLCFWDGVQQRLELPA